MRLLLFMILQTLVGGAVLTRLLHLLVDLFGFLAVRVLRQILSLAFRAQLRPPISSLQGAAAEGVVGQQAITSVLIDFHFLVLYTNLGMRPPFMAITRLSTARR